MIAPHAIQRHPSNAQPRLRVLHSGCRRACWAMMMRQARRSSAIQHYTVRCGFLSQRSYVAPSRQRRSSSKRPRKELTYCPIYGFKSFLICAKELTPALFCLRLRVDDRKRLFRGDAAASLAFRADGWGACRQLSSDHQSPITNHQSPITNHRSPITDPPTHRPTDPPTHRPTDPSPSPSPSPPHHKRKRRPKAPSICCGLSGKLIRTCDGYRRVPRPGCSCSTRPDR